MSRSVVQSSRYSISLVTHESRLPRSGLDQSWPASGVIRTSPAGMRITCLASTSYSDSMPFASPKYISLLDMPSGTLPSTHINLTRLAGKLKTAPSGLSGPNGGCPLATLFAASSPIDTDATRARDMTRARGRIMIRLGRADTNPLHQLSNTFIPSSVQSAAWRMSRPRLSRRRAGPLRPSLVFGVDRMRNLMVRHAQRRTIRFKRSGKLVSRRSDSILNEAPRNQQPKASVSTIFKSAGGLASRFPSPSIRRNAAKDAYVGRCAGLAGAKRSKPQPAATASIPATMTMLKAALPIMLTGVIPASSGLMPNRR
jgi:hypothetical protein